MRFFIFPHESKSQCTPQFSAYVLFDQEHKTMPNVTTAWTTICEDIATLHLAADSFEKMPSEHQPELIELMRLSTQRLTDRLGELDRNNQIAEHTPATPNGPLDESQKQIRRNRPKRTTPKGSVAVTVLTDTDRCEGIVINESDTGMGITISIFEPPPIEDGHNVRIIHQRRLRLARVVRTVADANGRFEVGVKWL